MSMPQPISVVIVSSDRKRLDEIDNALNLPQLGIAPRYYLATPEEDIDEIVNPEKYEYGFVHQWIATDSKAYSFCLTKHSENINKPSYSRGFYDKFLPNPIFRSTSERMTIKELKQHTKVIGEAFCATS
jgi:hypothetical protein